MKALVTGSAGFVGRHMVAELESRGWDVYEYDIAGYGRPNSSYDILEVFRRGYQITFDLVVHCAYLVGGRAAIDGTNMNLAKNLQLDASLFEWAVRTKQRRVLYFSSSAVYPVEAQSLGVLNTWKLSPFTRDKAAEMMQLREKDWEDHIDAQWADADYGYAKCVGERLARTARENGVPTTVVRPFSGYGEDQSLDYPFPSIIRRAKEGDLSVWGPPGQTRDWIHISDVIKGSLAVVESGTELSVNLCTGVGTEMGELAGLVAYEAGVVENMSLATERVAYDVGKPTGVFYRVGSTERMNQFYTAKISIEEGIERAINAQR